MWNETARGDLERWKKKKRLFWKWPKMIVIDNKWHQKSCKKILKLRNSLEKNTKWPEVVQHDNKRPKILPTPKFITKSNQNYRNWE